MKNIDNINKFNDIGRKKSKFRSMVSGAIFLALMSSTHNLPAKSHIQNFIDKNKVEIKNEGLQVPNGQSDSYNIGDSLNIYGFSDFVLIGQEEKDFLKDWINHNSFIDLSIISREDFNELHGDFLIYSGEHEHTKFGNYKKYILKLPLDLKLGELASIIKRVNEITFDGKMPNNASFIEIKKNIQGVIVYLLSLKDKYNTKDVKKAINKYYKLYQYYFPGQKLEIDTTANHQKQVATKQFSNTIRNIDKEYSGYSFNVVERVVDESIANNIYNHFFESFFENGSEILSNVSGLKTKLSIDKLKIDLEKAKRTKNKYLIVKKEREILDYLIKSIRSLGLERENIYSTVYDASSPRKIIETGDIACVGYSIISSNILEKLGISYDVVTEPGHSLCVVSLSDGKKYLFDALRNNKIIKYNIIGKEGMWNLITYKTESGKEEKSKIIGSDGNPQSTILMQIMANKANGIVGEDKDSYKKKLYVLNRATNISNKNPEVFYAKAYILNELGEYKQALSAINYSIKLSPKNSISWLLKSMICENLGDFVTADFANKKYEELSK